jgi:hypothetical protein
MQVSKAALAAQQTRRRGYAAESAFHSHVQTVASLALNHGYSDCRR